MRLVSSAALLAVAASTTSAATTQYPLCTTQQTQQYFSSLSNELAQCKTTSTFDLTAGLLPTTEQRSAVCKCTSLIKQLPYIRVPRCKIQLDGNPYKITDAMVSIFAECGTITLQEEPLPEKGSASGSGEVSGEADATPVVKPAANSTSSANATEEANASGSSDTSIESVPEPAPTTKAPVKEKQATPAPVATAAPTTAPPKSSATSLVAWSMATGLVATTAAMLSA